MKKILSLFVVLLMVSSIGFAQTILFEDDFEGFTVGDNVSTGDWDTWSGDTGGVDDAVISDTYNHTDAGANSLVVATDQDIIYSFGDVTSGKYQVKFWYYLPTGQGGYFNVQHDFGVNWALSVEMMPGGNGNLKYDYPSETVNFTFPQDEWFEIIMDIDFTADEIILTINDVIVNTWTFSLSESDSEPMAVLDCINFYAPSSVTPPYYIDDFVYTQVEVGVEKPEIELSVTEFTVDGSSNSTLTLNNTGGEILTFEALVNYSQAVVKGQNNTGTTTTTTTTQKMVNLTPAVSKLDKPVKMNLNSKDADLTHILGDVSSNFGWGGTDNVDAEAGVLFKYDNNPDAVNLKDYIGMSISNVIIMIGDLPLVGSTELRVYEGRDGIENGPMDAPLSTEEFTATTASEQITVALTTPVFVGGKDIFVAWTLTQLPDERCISMDEGPPVAGANWTNTGVAWSEVTNPDFGNFSIVALLTGEAMHQWLTLSATEGTVAIDGSEDIELQFDITGMATGEYTCNVVLKTTDNDDDESYIEIPVTINVIQDIEGTSNSIATYPNPTTDFFNVVASENINQINVLTVSGQMVRNISLNTNTYKVNTSDLQAGIYFFEITTEKQTITKKVIVK